MMLIPRALVRSLLIAAPAAFVVTAAVDLLRTHDMKSALEGVVVSQVNTQIRERCESDPTWFLTGPLEGRPPRGQFVTDDPNALEPRPRYQPQPYELFAYDEAFLGSGPATPRFPNELRSRVRGSSAPVSGAYDLPGLTADTGMVAPIAFLANLVRVRGALVAVDTGWIGSRCQYLLGRMQPTSGRWTARLMWLVSLFGLFFGVAFLAMSSTVSRIRRLASDQREAVADNHAAIAPDSRSDELSSLAFMFNDAMTELHQRDTTIEDQDAALRRLVQSAEDEIVQSVAALEEKLAAMTQGGVGDPAVLLRETHDLRTRVENLVVVSKLRMAGPPAPTRVDLSAVVSRIAERHASVARSDGISLKSLVPEPPVYIEADEALIERAVSNVVDNAIRYNTPGGAVTIGLKREGESKRFRLWIADTGRGVSEEAFKGLTAIRRFRGDESRNRRPGAPGLGLAVAREVADRFGLTLELRRPGAGGFEVEFAGVES